LDSNVEHWQPLRVVADRKAMEIFVRINILRVCQTFFARFRGQFVAVSSVQGDVTWFSQPAGQGSSPLVNDCLNAGPHPSSTWDARSAPVSSPLVTHGDAEHGGAIQGLEYSVDRRLGRKTL
jgi:hypothetical protein